MLKKKSSYETSSNDDLSDVHMNVLKSIPNIYNNNNNNMGEYFLGKDGSLQKIHGISWIMAALFVIADMVGAGIVALPKAMIDCSFWLGLSLLLLMALIGTISSIMLGKCWTSLLRRFPKYRQHCRKPYAEIANQAMGFKMKRFVSVCVLLTQIGASTAFLLLTANNLQTFLNSFWNININHCFLIVIAALILLPLTMLKSPQDFWPIVVLGMLTTLIAVILLIIGSSMDYNDCSSEWQFVSLKLENIGIAFGTILFTYGGHSTIPTIHHDMRKPSDFGKTSLLAFLLITIMYTSTVCVASLTYGTSLRESVIDLIQTFWIKQAVNIMITGHCLLTITLILNTVNQEMEDYFKVPHDFGIKRILIRSSVMGLIVFLGASIPQFDTIMALYGGSTIALTSVVFPGLFYLYLTVGEKLNKKVNIKEIYQETDKRILVAIIFIIGFGILLGTATTIIAIYKITKTNFDDKPCYIKAFTNDPTNNSKFIMAKNYTEIYCCGMNQNISRYVNNIDYKCY